MQGRGKAVVAVAIAGDANDRSAWSGTAAHLIEGAREAGLPFEGLALRRPGEWTRRAWNLARVATSGTYGGFQYSPMFLHHLWRAERLAGRTILSCYQVLPDWVLDHARMDRWFYIDGTLTQLWASPDYTARALPPAVVRSVLDRERHGYATAAGVICHSRWAADSVVKEYGVPAGRVHVVVPGANLEPDSYSRWRAQPQRAVPEGPLRLVFVGMDGVRKGLDRLLEALPIVRARGAATALTVIGCSAAAMPPGLAAVFGVEWLGPVDKRKEAKRFLEVVTAAEVGCLLSRAEFGGMAQREFAALGLLGLGPEVDGAPEHAGPGALLVPPDATPAAIADLLVELARRGDTYHRLRTAAWTAREAATWPAAARELYRIIAA